MVKLIQNSKTKNWTTIVLSPTVKTELVNVHSPAACEGRGCAVHNHPSDHKLQNAPLNWREDRGILERVCQHGVGHPDHDSAVYLASIGQNVQNVHGCDGCC